MYQVSVEKEDNKLNELEDIVIVPNLLSSGLNEIEYNESNQQVSK